VQNIPAPHIAVSVLHSPQPFTDLLLRVKACRHYLPPSDVEKISVQTEARLRDLLENPEDGYLPQLQRIMGTILSGDAACWYGQDGKVIVDKPQQPQKPADMLCEELFKQRCRINHPDINFVHDSKWRQGTNTALKQAVKVLLEAERVMIDNGNPDNHGEKRYLEKVLLKGAGALKKTGVEGRVTFFDCESNPDKIADAFPVLKELCRRLRDLNPGATLSLGSFLMEAKTPPYGIGGTAVVLTLAHVVRAFGERLRIYKDSTKNVEVSINTYESLLEVVLFAPTTKIVFEVRDISPAQAALVDGVAKAVQAPPLKYGETRTLNSTYEALVQWWQKIPQVAEIMELYEPTQQKRLRQLKEVLDQAENFDRFDLILNRLPGIYIGGPVGDDLSETEAETVSTGFAADVKLFESGFHLVRTALAEAVNQLFGSKGDMVQCEKVITEWYQGLNPTQRNPFKFEEEAHHLLLRLEEKVVDFEDKILKKLPEDYGLGQVADWSTLYVKDYVEKLTQAKATIEEAKPEVPIPPIKPNSYELKEKDKLEVAIPSGATEIIYAVGEDPQKAENFRVAEATLNLADLLGDSPSATIFMRSRDAEGNLSDPVKVELVNKTREYEIQIMKDLFKDKGVFKFPEDTQGMVAVISSLLKHGVKRNVLKQEEMDKVVAAVQALFGKSVN
jgi:hypothetical protein